MSEITKFTKTVTKFKAVPRLNEILKERGLTQLEFSEMSGLLQGTVSRFDKTQNFNFENLLTAAHALDLSIEELFSIQPYEVEVEIEKDKRGHIKITQVEEQK